MNRMTNSLDFQAQALTLRAERQRIIAGNIANADTPGFKPSDLKQPSFDRQGPQGGITLATTSSGHVGGMGAGSKFTGERQVGYESRPTGNAVNLEDEMLKVASNQMDYQAATSLYTKSLGLVKTALGKR